MAAACFMVLMAERSSAYMGCSGSMASFTPEAAAWGRTAAMPSAICRRASRERHARHRPAHQHDERRAQRGRLVDHPAVLVDGRLPPQGVTRREEAAPAQARRS
jgi:hypothetical protein